MVNVDPNELDKFARFAHEWWDPNGKCKPLHDINPLRLDWLETQVSGLSGKRVADVGCGGGLLSEGMAARGAAVLGIDLTEKILEVAKLHLLESGLTVDYRLSSAEDLVKEHAEQFDVVTCMEMLEHVPDPASTVEACAQLLKPGGKVVFATLNRTLKSYFGAIIGAEYILQWLPKGTHYFDKFIRPAELSRWAKHAGLEVEALSGLSYQLLSQRYRLSDDLSINYFLCAQKPLAA